MKIKIPIIYHNFINKNVSENKYLFSETELIEFNIQELNSVDTIAKMKLNHKFSLKSQLNISSNIMQSIQNHINNSDIYTIFDDAIKKIDEIEIKEFNNKFFYKCYYLEYIKKSETLLKNDIFKTKEIFKSDFKNVQKNNIEKYLSSKYSPLNSKANTLKFQHDLDDRNNQLFYSFKETDYKDFLNDTLTKENINFIDKKQNKTKKEYIKRTSNIPNNIINGKEKLISIYKQLENDFIIINNELWCSEELPVLTKDYYYFDNKLNQKVYKDKTDNEINIEYITYKNKKFIQEYKKEYIEKQLRANAMNLLFNISSSMDLFLYSNDLGNLLKRNNFDIKIDKDKIMENFLNDYFIIKKYFSKIISKILIKDNKELIENIDLLEKNIKNHSITKLLSKLKNQNLQHFHIDDSFYIEQSKKELNKIYNEINKFNKFIKEEYLFKDINMDEIKENTLKF